MIRNLMIDNLKSINHLELGCTNLNLFIGTNSSGKSTIIQGLLLLVQNWENLCGLNGRLTAIGDFVESKCRFVNRNKISVTVDMGEHMEPCLIIGTSEEQKNPQVTINYDEGIEKSTHVRSLLSIKDRMIQYLSCTRTGPQRSYEKNMQQYDEIGIEGKYAFSYLCMHGNNVLEKTLCKDDASYTLDYQVNYWLKYITGVSVNSEEIPQADIIKVTYSDGMLKNLRPLNVGAGISYVASVLIACLSAPQKGIIIVENPEIHLHPLAQSRLCEFFYFISLSGRQLFLESHSDHIFNGFRAGITLDTMEQEKVNIYFVSRDEDGVSKVERVRIGKRGRILNQQPDLFDQFDKDMIRMIGISQ